MIYTLSRAAVRCIEEIVRYTDTNFGTEQTQIYVAGLFNSFERLSKNPRIGRPYDSTRRRHIYENHQIYYRITKTGILIVDIRNARQVPPEPLGRIPIILVRSRLR